ncbi:polyribonucleotide nucleotidyltransferase [candidate division WWE3 bacterium RBG_16_37_10]|uniref:Polyribonucleotide nucleotidyltransferase n=1 Tax=candidate division WWE3 bacterium RBG_16_37_10 TaxID=1802610 RepID=A0A1F4V383_UNCKA|nr:MAG: polyribonucleotide nucleotidyltransferase [candidate division WWE3 bacterium RBG_16_37_10]
MKKIVKKELDFFGKKLVLETGDLAVQANMAVKATYGDTVILVTAVANKPSVETDFFPLTVNYEEKLYASGFIKSSRFIKRDGRATDEAVVSRRMIDHAIRPLFPNDYKDEVQVIVTILSLDNTSNPEFLAMIGVSACLTASDIPFEGLMSSLEVGYIDGNYIANPNYEIVENSLIDMMVSFSGEDKKFLAVEAEVKLQPEEIVLSAIEFAWNNVDPLIQLIKDFAHEVNPENKKYKYDSKALSSEIMKDVSAVAKDKIVEMLGMGFDKTKLRDSLDELKSGVVTQFEGKYKKADLMNALEEIEKHSLQHLILEEGKRPDGRGIKDIRPISSSISVLPRTHGSALFSRGITQVLTVTTLGSPSQELFIQDMYGEKTKRFIHYYNFPPFSTGETGKIGSPGSREIGHGLLAERALKAVIPSQKEFPYMIILVSETLSSSGSSSMASACASTLALMDAGVPIKEMVGGVGVGLIVNDDLSKIQIMTDLAYMEDAFGFLDFKMTGTRTGVTAMQADMKLPGIPMSLLPKIMEQSKEGRMQVLDEMEKTIKTPKEQVSQYAPKTVVVKIDTDKIGVVIGAGGRTIKDIQDKTETVLTIEQDGSVVITASTEENAHKAAEMVIGLVKDVKPGEVYEGTVSDIVDFGAFVEILPNKDGLLHISEISNEYVKDVNDFLKIGDKVTVKVLAVENGKISLSKKALESNDFDGSNRPRDDRDSRDRNVRDRGGRNFERNRDRNDGKHYGGDRRRR